MVAIDIFYCLLIPALFYYLCKREKEADELLITDLPAPNEAIKKIYYHILDQRITYFRNLNEEGRNHFISRMHKFIGSRTFIGAEGLVVTDEMKVLVSAAAIQLTFGLDEYLFANISRIHIHASTFYSNYIRKEVKGLTTNNGSLSVSFHDLSEGYRNDDDGYNLGLHEMAHALKLNAQEGFNADNGFVKDLEMWAEVSEEVIERHSETPDQFLRPYAYTNGDEFFAVCVENFFEAPEEFSKRIPQLYDWLCSMLGQNPLSIHHNYNVLISEEQDEIDERRFSRLKRVMMHVTGQDRWHWSANVFIGGLFIGGIITYMLMLNTAMPISHLFTIGCITAAGMAIVQYKTVVLLGYYTPFQYIGYTLLGMLPFSMSLYILLNFLIPVNIYNEEHEIKGFDTYGSMYVVTFKDDAWHDFEKLRILKASTMNDLYYKKYNSIRLEIRMGIMGYAVVGNDEAVPSPNKPPAEPEEQTDSKDI